MMQSKSHPTEISFIGYYKIGAVLFHNLDTIGYIAEDMRKSTPVLITKNLLQSENTGEFNRIIHILKTNLHSNLSKIQDVYFDNNTVYIVSDMPLDISVQTYLDTNKFFSESEINNFITSLLSIFIFLSKHNLMIDSIELDQIYRDEKGKYSVYGLLPVKQSSNYIEHDIALIRQIMMTTINFGNEHVIKYSSSFHQFLERITSDDSTIQPKRLEDLIPLFKTASYINDNIMAEPLINNEKAYPDKTWLWSTVFMTLLLGGYLLLQRPESNNLNNNETKVPLQSPSIVDHIIPEANDSNLPPLASQESNISLTQPLTDAAPLNLTVHRAPEPTSVNTQLVQDTPQFQIDESTDKFIDFGEYIQDRKTGLLWQKDGQSSGKLNFYQAKDYAYSLTLGNLKGWRVPTIAELKSIFPALEKPFKNTPYTDQPCCKGPYIWPNYWTSEMDNRLPDYAYIYQWYQFGGANNGYASRNYGYVRCVRNP